MSYNNDRIVSDVIDALKGRLNPEDVFDESELEKWARDNGFVKEDEVDE